MATFRARLVIPGTRGNRALVLFFLLFLFLLFLFLPVCLLFLRLFLRYKCTWRKSELSGQRRRSRGPCRGTRSWAVDRPVHKSL
jgi:hypothetical protein